MTQRPGRFGHAWLILSELWNILLLLARKLQPLLILSMLGLIAWALLATQPWPFAIEAETEHVTLFVARDVETNWRVDGAELCVRSTVAALPLPPLQGDAACPGRRWRAHALAGMREMTLRLPALPQSAPAYRVRLDVEGDGALLVQIATDDDSGEPLALLPPDVQSALPLGNQVILRFPAAIADAPLGRVLLPFTGDGSIGKDVSWRESTLLRRGSIQLYTRSEEAAGGRTLVAATDLLPGDRVDLSQGGPRGRKVAKGFVHFDLVHAPQEPPVLRVVAFGEADSIHIVRFGEQGYNFSPGLFVRLTHHSAVATWVVLLFSILGLMAVYREASEIGEGALSERRRVLAAHWRALRGRE